MLGKHVFISVCPVQPFVFCSDASRCQTFRPDWSVSVHWLVLYDACRHSNKCLLAENAYFTAKSHKLTVCGMLCLTLFTKFSQYFELKLIMIVVIWKQDQIPSSSCCCSTKGRNRSKMIEPEWADPWSLVSIPMQIELKKQEIRAISGLCWILGFVFIHLSWSGSGLQQVCWFWAGPAGQTHKELVKWISL